MANIFIEDLAVDTVIGLCEWEKHVEQRLFFDIDMQVDISDAASGDNLEASVDYACVAQQVSDFTQAQQCLLLETLIERLLRYLLCLLYTSDAADDMQCVDFGGRRIIKKKK